MGCAGPAAGRLSLGTYLGFPCRPSGGGNSYGYQPFAASSLASSGGRCRSQPAQRTRQTGVAALTWKSDSLKSYDTFQPILPNFLLSCTTAWKKAST